VNGLAINPINPDEEIAEELGDQLNRTAP